MKDKHKWWRGKVGPPELFDVIGAQQFYVMTLAGLRAHHKMLDVGSGCFRGGRFFIPYLDAGNYRYVEPNKELVMLGMEYEVGLDMMQMKHPMGWFRDDFKFSEMMVPDNYDYILAQSILSHTGYDLLDIVMREAYKALKPGGIFVATYFRGNAKEFKEGWCGDEPVVYEGFWMMGRLRSIGFNPSELNIEHPMGQTWFIALKGE